MNIHKNPSLFFLLTFLFSSLHIEANHLRGGKISMKHIFGNTYELEVLMYSDSYSGSAGGALVATIYDMNFVNANPYHYNDDNYFPQNFVIIDEIILNGSHATLDECHNNFNNSFKRFTNQFTLDSQNYQSSGGYWIEVKDFNRDESVNTSNPLGSFLLLGYWFDQNYFMNGVTNNSPSIEMPTSGSKPQFGNKFFHDFNVKDIDRDQVSFNFYQPFNNSYGDKLQWLNGFNTNQPFGTGSTTIISNEILKFTPYVNGKFSYGVEMKEIRNGQVIAKTYTDLYMAVGGNMSNPFNFIPSTGGQIEFCQDGSNHTVQTDLNVPNTDYQFYWYQGSFMNPVSEWTSSKLIQASAGNYNLIVKVKSRSGTGNAAQNQCGFDYGTVNIDYAQKYSVPQISSLGSSLCIPGSNYITVNNLSSKLEYYLYELNSPQAVSGPHSSSGKSIQIPVMTSGAYYVEGVDPNFPGACNYASNKLSLLIKPYNTISLNLPPSIYFCENDLIQISNNTPSNAPGITYSYHYSGGLVNTNSNNSYFELVASSPGWHTFTITADGINGCKNKKSYDFYTTAAACCKSDLQVLDQSVINSGQNNFMGDYLVTESLILSPNTNYIFDGNFYFKSEVIDFMEIDMPSLSLRTGTVLQIEPNSKLTAYCDIMWEGIKLNNGTLIASESEISHALIGIDGTHSAMKVNLQGKDFYNNLIGISGEVMDKGWSDLPFQISNNRFNTSPDDMLYPNNKSGPGQEWIPDPCKKSKPVSGFKYELNYPTLTLIDTSVSGMTYYDTSYTNTWTVNGMPYNGIDTLAIQIDTSTNPNIDVELIIQNFYGCKDTAIYSNRTTSVADRSFFDLNIFPNPAKGEITISNRDKIREELEFNLISLEGNRVFSKKIQIGESRITLPNSFKGMYLYEISSLSQIKKGKLILIE